MNQKILLLDDGLNLNKAFRNILEKEGIQVILIDGSMSVSEILENKAVDLVIVDSLKLSYEIHNQLLMGIEQAESQNLPFIFLGGDIDLPSPFDLGLKIVLNTPVSQESLLTVVQNTLGEKRRRDLWNLKGGDESFNRELYL
ncbi:hypothetical protein LZF95_03580 [Algoriphagus sp. AGSA1]|uniref:hypothetical protein n=1 Tax=Algoriphagus sp. AGSA1 TaxID=2907213 RepID=UPI001F37972F|nr:hypothetical protein [Algoriphagus sp. AGSA1]MCE7053746.1 hypothetical protein [Algoriphagus sp. AGSA1]